ncbi:acyl--CoA ligase [Pseudomonas resinovorans]|uniref:Acyl--CoA ligase n=1 Tax=Metapseudomonas resinovorans TaxID=53412 RepID=A0ABT4YCN0_METRE|nr:class I adenylate-forming enzyme family protein [Pseudomonas resinovorans]MDA8486506.1 acyl--CoA ligase [Pseudomonas resinovorans]
MLLDATDDVSYEGLFGTVNAEKIAMTTNRLRTHPYGELYQRIRHYSALLMQSKIPQDGCVSFLLSDPFEMAALAIATLRLRRVLFPISPNMASQEAIVNMLGRARPHLFVHDLPDLNEGLKRKCQYIAAPADAPEHLGVDLDTFMRDVKQEDGMALIMHSSGSTGTPKMVYYNHSNLMKLFEYKIRHFGFSVESTCMTCSAGYHLNGFYMAMCTLLQGGHIINSFEITGTPQYELIRAHRPSILVLYPDLLVDFTHQLDRRNEGAPYIRCLITGGDTVPVNSLRRFFELTGRLPITMIGMTECPTYMGNNTNLEKLGSFGHTPLPGYEIRLIHTCEEAGGGTVGEVELRSLAASSGYLAEDLTGGVTQQQDGWIQTGDILRRDAEGYYWFVSRRKDVVLRNAITIPLSEIEDALLSYDKVENACVVVMESRDFGLTNYDRQITAFVTFRQDADLPGLRRFVANNLADFKNPDQIHVVTSFPRNASGKIDKNALIALHT